MGYISIQFNKVKGSADTGASDHIERKTLPKNANPTRTCLNRELVDFPDGVTNRTEAINHRIRTAGIKRKITPDQVRAIRINVSGTHEDMERIEKEGRLDEWCADNLKYFADLFGKENIVAAHLHRDEETPHIHITLVPIVKGERKRRKREEQAKKRYRKKPTDTVRLCADDIMSRLKLKAYQDSYAVAMKKYGLQRGVDGSEARHVSTQQYYRDIKRQTEELKTEVVELQERKETAREELERAKKEIQTERLKGAATTAAANIAESVGSLFGSNKVKTLERENTALHRKVATHEETIEALQAEIQTIRADHSRQVLEMQQRHLLEKNETVTKHQTEVSRLNALLIKATEWFPWFRAMLRIEKLCLAVGFTHEQTAHLMTGKPLPYNGELYSDEHRRKFKTNDVTAKVGTNNGKLILAIDGLHIGEWFKKQFERLQQNVGLKPIQKKNKGFKL